MPLSYDLQIDNDANFSSPVASPTTKMSAYAYTEPLAAGTYYWRVRRNDADNRDGGWSAVRSFDLAPASPTLVSPTNGSSPSAATLLLTWTATQPSPKYQVQLSTSSTFASYVSGFPLTTVMKSWAPKTLLGTGTYYWRVRALNASNTPVATSSTFRFSIGLPGGYGDTPFTDIGNSTFKADIEWVFAKGSRSAARPTLFCPTDRSPVARWRPSWSARSICRRPRTDYFTDDETSSHEDNINRVRAAGITWAAARPSTARSRVTREQMATFLAKGFDLPATATDYFTDDETSCHEANINKVRAAGITIGCTATTYCPKADVTRGQMAAFLRRALEN